MGSREFWKSAWDVFLDVGVNLWIVWLVLGVLVAIGVQSLLR